MKTKASGIVVSVQLLLVISCYVHSCHTTYLFFSIIACYTDEFQPLFHNKLYLKNAVLNKYIIFVIVL